MVKIKLSTGAFGSCNERQSGIPMKENKDNDTFKDTSLFKLKVAHGGNKASMHNFSPFLQPCILFGDHCESPETLYKKKKSININKLYMLKCTNLYEKTFCIYINFYFAL